MGTPLLYIALTLAEYIHFKIFNATPISPMWLCGSLVGRDTLPHGEFNSRLISSYHGAGSWDFPGVTRTLA